MTATHRRAGLAVNIGQALAGLAFIAILYTFTTEIWRRLTDATAQHVTGSTARTGLHWTEAVYDHFLLIALVVTVLGMLAYSVYSGPGGV